MSEQPTEALTPVPPTQVQHPAKAVNRTVLAAVVAFFPLINGILLAVQDWLVENTTIIPAELYAWVNGVLVAALALVALVTRVLAVPGVNDWLRDHLAFLAADSSPGKHVQ